MLAFVRNMVGVKTDQAVGSMLETLVRFDPKSATEAELRTMEQQLDGLGIQVAEARRGWEKEHQEAEAILKLHKQRLAAAEQIEGRLASETDPTKRTGLEKSLGTLVTMLEEMQPEIEREQREEVEAKEFLDMLESSYATAGGKLKTARAALQKAQRDMTRADHQRQQAETRAEAARQQAGLSQATSGLSVALKAMQDAAARDLAHAESAKMKASLLQPSNPEKEDANIAAAMAAASGTAEPATSLSDRLAKLRQPRG